MASPERRALRGLTALVVAGLAGCGGAATAATEARETPAPAEEPVFDRVIVSAGRALAIVGELEAAEREATAEIEYEAAEGGPLIEVGPLPDAPPATRWTVAMPGCTATAAGSRWLRIVDGTDEAPTFRAVELEGCAFEDAAGEYLAVRGGSGARWADAAQTNADDAPELGPQLRREGTLGEDASYVETFSPFEEVCPGLPATIEVRRGDATVATLDLDTVETWLRGAFTVGDRLYVVVHRCGGDTRLILVGDGEPRTVVRHAHLGEEFCEC